MTIIIFLVIILAIGGLGGIVTGPAIEQWYIFLNKPPLTPPSWIFAPVWTVLYVMMAVAGARLWKVGSEQSVRLRWLFVLQLMFNGLWSPIFFGMRNALAGLGDILLLWVFLAALVRLSWREDKISALLLAPYFLWVSFATYLNIGLWWLNR